MSKYDLPIAIHTIINPYLEINRHLFTAVKETNYPLLLKHTVEESHFQFCITKLTSNKDDLFIHVRKTPASASNPAESSHILNIAEFGSSFGEWIGILKFYSENITIHDDPYVIKFADEFFNKFEINEPDAHTLPFSIEKILQLDEILETVDTQISEYVTEDNVSDIKEIKSDIKQIRERLGREPKYWIVKRVSQLYAKVLKMAPKLLKTASAETAKVLFKIIIEKGLQQL